MAANNRKLEYEVNMRLNKTSAAQLAAEVAASIEAAVAKLHALQAEQFPTYGTRTTKTGQMQYYDPTTGRVVSKAIGDAAAEGRAFNEQEQATALTKLNGLLKDQAALQTLVAAETRKANAAVKESTELAEKNTRAKEDNRKAAERASEQARRDALRQYPSSSIYEHKKAEQVKADAQKLADVLHNRGMLTKEQLAKEGRAWGQYASIVKQHDKEAYDAVQAGFFRQKELLIARQAIERKHLEFEKAVAIEVAKTKKERARVEKEWDDKILQANKAHNAAVKTESQRALQEQRRLQGTAGRGSRGGLEIGGGTTGRGLISGVAGLGGVNLYGLGIAGATSAGIRAALNAYADVFNTKNVLAGIVQTFSQFKDSDGRNLERGANFEQSQKYSNYLYGRVRKAAVDSPLTLKELTDVYTTGVPFLARSGVDFEKSIGITNTVASLGKMMGLRLDSIKDDIRAIYEGRFRNVQTFQAAGFTASDFKKLSNLRGDDLVKFFDQKFAGYQDALKKFAGSFTAQWDRLKDSLYQSAALIGEKVAPVFIKFATDMQETFSRWTADGTFDRFATQLNMTLQALASGLQYLLVAVGGFSSTFVKAISQIFAFANRTINGAENGKASLTSFQAIQNAFSSNEDWKSQMETFLTIASGTKDKSPGTLINAVEAISKNPSLLSKYRQGTIGLKSAYSNFSAVNRAEALAKELEAEYAQFSDSGYIPAILGIGRSITQSKKKQTGLGKDARFLEYEKLRNQINGFSGLDYGSGSTSFARARATAKSEFDTIVNQFFGSDTTNMVGMGVAADALRRAGVTESDLAVLESNPQSAKAGVIRGKIQQVLKSAQAALTPTLMNTAGIKVPKPRIGGAGPSITHIEPDITSELKQISAIEASQFELQKRAAYGADVSEEYRALEFKKNDLERQIALKQANKTTVLTGGSGVEELARSYQDKLRAFAKASGGKVRLGKMSRTFAEQTALWNAALKKYGSEKEASRWVARPGTSNHEFGLANDLSFGPGGVRWAHANAAKFGLGFPMAHENWHIELAGGSKAARLRLQLQNKSTVASNKSGQIDNRFDERDRALQLEAIREAEQTKRDNYRRNKALVLSNTEFSLRKDLAGKDVPAQYAAKLKILNAKYPGLERLSTAYRDEKAQLDQEFEDAKRQAAEEYASENEALEVKTKARQREAFLTQFKNRQGLVGLFGSDLAKAKLDQDIAAKEGMMANGGIGGAWAATILPALYEQRRALERNTEALNKQLNTKFNNAVKGIFDAPEFLSPSQAYRRGFDKKIEAIDNMSSSDLNAYRASLGMVGMGYTDDQLRGMLKLQATRGFSSAGFRNMQRRDQLFGGANAFLSALQSGGDPIAAFAGAYQNVDGQEAQQRLIQGLFNRGSYGRMEISGMSKYGPVFKRGFNKGAFNRDLISGGGSLVANMLVNTMGGQAQMGGQIGGMLAPLLFTGLGAWAGPLGILGGGLIGSLFGRKKQQDPSIEQHRKRLEELLQSINNRLKPQEDFYRTIKGSVLWGSASRSFGGRASSLGARVELGVI